MRTLQELIKACTPILISGEMFDGDKFEEQPAVILPDWASEEETEHHDDLIEHWFDQDYWMVFYHEEEIIGNQSECMGCVVESYKSAT